MTSLSGVEPAVTGSAPTQPSSPGTLTSRERVRWTLSHREPDRIPLDLGTNSAAGGLSITAYRRLLERLGLGLLSERIQVADTVEQLALVDEPVLRTLGVDVRGISPQPASPADVVVEGDYLAFTDALGIHYAMPRDGGLYFDMVRHPLADAETIGDLDAYAFPEPDPRASEALASRASALAGASSESAIVLFGLNGGIFEMACRLRGFERFLLDLGGNRTFATAILRRVLEFKIARWLELLNAVGDSVLVVLESDDLGTQRGPLIAPTMYREIIKPLHRELFDTIRAAAGGELYLLLHSCGSVAELIPDFIQLGVDALNPLQSTAAGMDLAVLKRRFGNEIAFWGGGAATQTVLCQGTPEDVREQVRRRIDLLAPGGGFVFAPEHNIQADVPIDNLMAMWEAFVEHAAY